MDFSVFDVVLDSIIVINKDYEVIYCNEVAAGLADSSVRRMTRGKKIGEFINFIEDNLFFQSSGDAGRDEAIPLQEMDYTLVNGEKSGKVQVSIQPFTISGEPNWVIFIRDVTLEEVLHGKYQDQLKELENYSKNLEKMVAERTAELNEANQMLAAIMNSLGQGFLVFDEKGDCLDIYTKACEDVLESIPAGKNIVSVLNCTGADKEQFEMWIQAVFSESLPFESLKDLGPQQYVHSAGKQITLDYFAIRSEDESKVKDIVLVATDKTAEFEANEALEREKKFAQMVVKLVTNRRQFASYWNGIENYIREIKKEANSSSPDINNIFRYLHTLEGESGSFFVQTIQMSSRKVQDTITEVRNSSEVDFSSVKAQFFDKLKELENSILSFSAENKELLDIVSSSDENVIEISIEQVHSFLELFRKNGLPAEVCDIFIEQTLKQPAEPAFSYFNSVVSEIAEKQNKKINEISIKGGNLRLDISYFEAFLASLVHVFRNIVDHGIENIEERHESGKPECGNISIELNAKSEESGQILHIDIQDDGRGINIDKIKEKIINNNLVDDIKNLNSHEIAQFVFHPGISSRDQAGEFSGRGVGMDAVKNEVEKLGGNVEIFSTLGKGTHLQFNIPLANGLKEQKKGA